MPVVPNYDGPKVTPTVGVTPTQFHDYSNQVIRPKFNTSGMSALMQKLQREQDDAAIARGQADVERYIADSAYGVADENGVRQGGWRSLKGGNALAPDDEGRGLVERVGEGLQKELQRVADTLPQSARKRFWDEYGTKRSNQVHAQTRAHVMQEDLVAKKDSYDGLVSTLTNNAATSVVTPGVFEQNIEALDKAVGEQGKFYGWDSIALADAKRKTRTAAISGGVAYLLREAEQTPDKYREALGVLNQYADKIDAGAEVKLRRATMQGIEKLELGELTDKGAEYFTQPTRYFANQTAYKDQDGLSIFDNGIIAQESGGEHFNPDGSVKVGRYKDGTMPKDPRQQAFGTSQVTYNAAKDVYKAHNWKWSDAEWEKIKADKGKNMDIGRLFFAGLLKQFKGDEDKAIVAYNQGAGNVRKAEKQAEKTGKPWVEFISPTGKAYLAGVKTKYEKRIKAPIVGKDGNVVSIFDPEYYQKYKTTATREEVEKWVLANDPKSNVNREYKEQAVSSLMAKVQQQKNDAVVSQQNGVNNITNWLYENNGRIEDLPVELKMQVTPGAMLQLEAVAKKIKEGDDSGDFLLWKKYEQFPEHYDNVSEDGVKVLIRQFPPDKRKSAYNTWAERHVKQKELPDSVAKLRRDADHGVFYDTFRPKKADVTEAAKVVMGAEEWKDAGEDFQVWMLNDVAQAITDASQRKGQAPSKEDIHAMVRQAFTTKFDRNGKSYSEFKEPSDLPNGGPNDVRALCTNIAQARVTGKGFNRKPTDAETMSVFRELMWTRNPDLTGLDIGSLRRSDNARVKSCIDKYKGATGKEPDDTTLVKLYMTSLLNGEEVTEYTDTMADNINRALSLGDTWDY